MPNSSSETTSVHFGFAGSAGVEDGTTELIKDKTFSCKAAIGLTDAESSVLVRLFTKTAPEIEDFHINCFDRGKSIKEFLAISSEDVANYFLVVFEIGYKQSSGESSRFFVYNFSKTELQEEIVKFDKRLPFNNSGAIVTLSDTNPLRLIYESIHEEMSSDLYRDSASGKFLFDYSGRKIEEAYCHYRAGFILRGHHKEQIASFLNPDYVKKTTTKKMITECQNILNRQSLTDSRPTGIAEEMKMPEYNRPSGSDSATVNLQETQPTTSGYSDVKTVPFKDLTRKQMEVEFIEDVTYFHKAVLDRAEFFSPESHRKVGIFRQKRLLELVEAGPSKIPNFTARLKLYNYFFAEPMSEYALIICRFMEWIPIERLLSYEMLYIKVLEKPDYEDNDQKNVADEERSNDDDDEKTDVPTPPGKQAINKNKAHKKKKGKKYRKK